MKAAREEEKRIAIVKGHIAADGIPYITAIVNGEWAKRSYRHGYNAFSGLVRVWGTYVNIITFLNCVLMRRVLVLVQLLRNLCGWEYETNFVEHALP